MYEKCNHYFHVREFILLLTIDFVNIFVKIMSNTSHVVKLFHIREITIDILVILLYVKFNCAIMFDRYKLYYKGAFQLEHKLIARARSA